VIAQGLKLGSQAGWLVGPRGQTEWQAAGRQAGAADGDLIVPSRLAEIFLKKETKCSSHPASPLSKVLSSDSSP